MTTLNICLHRLYNQQISRTRFKKPSAVVSWLGAVQAQDYLGSLWALGLRTGAAEKDIERALGNRSIVRTWPMRGTLHFVSRADVRWMLELLTPRVVAANTRRLKDDYELDEAVFARSRKVFERALQGGKQLSRNGMYQALEAAHISAKGQRGLHILWRLAQGARLFWGTPRQTTDLCIAG